MIPTRLLTDNGITRTQRWHKRPPEQEKNKEKQRASKTDPPPSRWHLRRRRRSLVSAIENDNQDKKIQWQRSYRIILPDHFRIDGCTDNRARRCRRTDRRGKTSRKNWCSCESLAPYQPIGRLQPRESEPWQSTKQRHSLASELQYLQFKSPSALYFLYNQPREGA